MLQNRTTRAESVLASGSPLPENHPTPVETFQPSPLSSPNPKAIGLRNSGRRAEKRPSARSVSGLSTLPIHERPNGSTERDRIKSQPPRTGRTAGRLTIFGGWLATSRFRVRRRDHRRTREPAGPPSPHVRRHLTELELRRGAHPPCAPSSLRQAYYLRFFPHASSACRADRVSREREPIERRALAHQSHGADHAWTR